MHYIYIRRPNLHRSTYKTLLLLITFCAYGYAIDIDCPPPTKPVELPNGMEVCKDPNERKTPAQPEQQEAPTPQKPRTEVPQPPPQQQPPPQTPPTEVGVQNNIGIRQGDTIVIKQNPEANRIWNEQQDQKSIDARLGYEGRHGQLIPMDQQTPAGPQVVGEFTDAKGNVWEKVRVNAQDVPQYLGNNAGKVYVVSVGGQPDEKVAGAKALASANTPEAKDGLVVKGEIKDPNASEKTDATNAPAAVTTFFKGLNEKMAEEAKNPEKARELASEEAKKEEAKPVAAGNKGEITINNDVALGGALGGADLSATGNLATELYRLKKGAAQRESFHGNTPSQLMSASVSAGDTQKVAVAKAGDVSAKRSLASTAEPEGFRKTFKNIIALLAGIVTLFLFRELGFFNKLKLATTGGGSRGAWFAGSQLVNQIRKAVPTGKPSWLPGGKKASEGTNATSATKMKRS